jgi:hypothetical protein
MHSVPFRRLAGPASVTLLSLSFPAGARGQVQKVSASAERRL